MKIEGVEYRWTRVNIPEDVEPVPFSELESNFKLVVPNAVLLGGLLLVKTKKKKKNK
jgi:hypothetical protein